MGLCEEVVLKYQVRFSGATDLRVQISLSGETNEQTKVSERNGQHDRGKNDDEESAPNAQDIGREAIETELLGLTLWGLYASKATR